MSTPELRKRLKAWYVACDRVKALHRQIVEATQDDEEARFEFFCDHGYAPPVIFPDYPEFPPEKQREFINADKMLRAEDMAAAAYFMLAQPRRTAVSLMRVETRLEHP